MILNGCQKKLQKTIEYKHEIIRRMDKNMDNEQYMRESYQNDLKNLKMIEEKIKKNTENVLSLFTIKHEAYKIERHHTYS